LRNGKKLLMHLIDGPFLQLR